MGEVGRGDDGGDGGDVGVVEEIGGAEVKREGAGGVGFAEFEGAAEVGVEVDEGGHGAEVAGHIAIGGVGGEQTEARGVDARAGAEAYEGRSLKTPSPLLSVPVVTLYGRAGLRVHLRGEGNLSGRL